MPKTSEKEKQRLRQKKTQLNEVKSGKAARRREYKNSVQATGGRTTGGHREYVEPLVMAAVATGIDGLFFEVHPDPERALSDKDCQLNPNDFVSILNKALKLRRFMEENNVD